MHAGRLSFEQTSFESGESSAVSIITDVSWQFQFHLRMITHVATAFSISGRRTEFARLYERALFHDAVGLSDTQVS